MTIFDLKVFRNQLAQLPIYNDSQEVLLSSMPGPVERECLAGLLEDLRKSAHAVEVYLSDLMDE